SSRRRHTRSKRDWSSDVCSSDLTMHLSTELLGLAVVAGESLGGVGNIQAAVGSTFHCAENTSAGGSSGKTNVEEASEGARLVVRSEERRVGKECRCEGEGWNWRE